MDKKKAIAIMKDLFKEDTTLNLKVCDTAAAWCKFRDSMTPLNWKHIGYVEALAVAFDIDNLGDK